MKERCDACGTENGSCNHYITRDGKEIAICPACLFGSDDALAMVARQAHREGRRKEEVLRQKGRKK